MTARAPVVGLSDHALEVLLDHAADVAPAFRNRFLAAVVDSLMPLENIADSDVSRACASIAAKIRAEERKERKEQRRASA
jgi:hypothetical protein